MPLETIAPFTSLASNPNDVNLVCQIDSSSKTRCSTLNPFHQHQHSHPHHHLQHHHHHHHHPQISSHPHTHHLYPPQLTPFQQTPELSKIQLIPRSPIVTNNDLDNLTNNKINVKNLNDQQIQKGEDDKSSDNLSSSVSNQHVEGPLITTYKDNPTINPLESYCTSEPTHTLIVTATLTRSTLVTTTAAISLQRHSESLTIPMNTNQNASTTEHTYLLQNTPASPALQVPGDLKKEKINTSDTKSPVRFYKSKSSVKHLQQQQEKSMEHQQRVIERQKSKSENRARKALRTISFILGAFIICWTPYHIAALVEGFCTASGGCVNRHFFYFTYFLCYANSPLNPFCYALMNQQFKKTFIRILSGDLHRT